MPDINSYIFLTDCLFERIFKKKKNMEGENEKLFYNFFVVYKNVGKYRCMKMDYVHEHEND